MDAEGTWSFLRGELSEAVRHYTKYFGSLLDSINTWWLLVYSFWAFEELEEIETRISGLHLFTGNLVSLRSCLQALLHYCPFVYFQGTRWASLPVLLGQAASS